MAVPRKAQLHRNRRALRDLLSNIYSNDVEAALVVFVQDNKWRFTYVSEIAVKDAAGKRTQKITDPKRYTYLFGEGEKVLTAARQFSQIKPDGDLFAKGVTLDALQEAFSVEKMSKAFFNEYRRHYGAFTAYLTGEDENSKETGKASSFLVSTFNDSKKEARDFVKKMLGRIVFLYFLEKKGWLGVPVSEAWGKGDENFLSNLFAQSGSNKEVFYSNVLAPLFFGALNTERKEDVFKLATGNKVKIPFLNGGLFEEDERKTKVLNFPEALFAELFKFFDRYNFTVYEDSPDEHTVAVDPEMLGHIFENLLEDNKDKGAYYTPKEIVHYMCQESLIEFLYTKLNPTTTDSFQELGKSQTDLFGNTGKTGQLTLMQKHETPKEVINRETLEKFIKQGDTGDVLDYEEAILTALHTVKVCDPAIGSGAFPMGVLMEIFHAIEALFEATPAVTKKVWKLKGSDWVSNRAAIKAAIIQNSIYGVDIEQGAVDIARLRFWLSLVVDEEVPQPLPNLDYKIVAGNSLLSKFEEEVIDIDWNTNTAKATEANRLIITQQASKLNTLQSWQAAFFNHSGDKAKHQFDIRNIKIDILVNQLMLTKISFQYANPKLGGFAPTAKEKQNNVENVLVIKGYDQMIQNLEAIKKNKTEHLQFFDWKLDFPEVMNDKVVKEVGFDIVIGNPPYVQLQKMGSETDLLFNAGFKTFSRSGDIYCLFYEIGNKLLKAKGSLVFITSNSWLRANYGKLLRNYLRTEANPLMLIDLSDSDIFQSATVRTNILQFAKSVNQNHLKALRLTRRSAQHLPVLSEYFTNNHSTIKSLTENAWVIADGGKSAIQKKVEAIGKPLKEWAIEINYGIKTGLNEAFVIDEDTRKQLIKEDKASENLIKPLLRGRDLYRYGFDFENLYLMNTHNGIKEKLIPAVNIKKYYPSIYSHMKQYKAKLEARLDKGNNWFNLRNCAYLYFTRDKLVDFYHQRIGNSG